VRFNVRFITWSKLGATEIHHTTRCQLQIRVEVLLLERLTLKQWIRLEAPDILTHRALSRRKAKQDSHSPIRDHTNLCG
jgi:hypothetical protein